MNVLAIDPGTTESGYMFLDSHRRPMEFGKTNNNAMRQTIWAECMAGSIDLVVIEMVESYGQPVGRETFETVMWIGLFLSAVGTVDYQLITRREVKRILCGRDTKVTDAVIRQRLIDIYGGSDAIGRKKNPGPLYGIVKDMWAALAVGVAWFQDQESQHSEIVLYKDFNYAHQNNA